MDMHPALPTRAIAPITALGKRNPLLLREKTGMPDHTRFVLVALGGLGMEYPLASWPRLPGICWIFPEGALTLPRSDFVTASRLGLNYVDLLASCDAVITKTGYGTQTEAVVNQIPTLCIARPGWPEEPNIPDWHAQHGELILTDWQTIQAGTFAQQILALLEMPWEKPLVFPNGAQQAAERLLNRITSP